MLKGLDKKVLRKDCAAVILYSAENATWMATQAIQALGSVFDVVGLIGKVEMVTSMTTQLEDTYEMLNFTKLEQVQAKLEDF